MQTSLELAKYFVYQITQSQIGIDNRIASATQSIDQLIENGWGLNDIKEELDQFARTYPQVVFNIYHVEEIMGNKQPPDNLIEQGMFYYHTALREVSPPVRMKFDEVTGEYVRTASTFYLEMKKTFTMQELLDYWYTKMGITRTDRLIRQDEGKFKYMLDTYTVEEILFCIDMSNSVRKEMELPKLKNAFDLEKYIEHARSLMREKENVHKMQGINREFKRNSTTG